ncbi:TetR/AcrR family transcriptional regulator (plasmid) [Novosphingobium sp. BL-8A]|uniref:TetR/AcrR family transcriptional regulator n=1 Tax=Novosphingobium sp. BL-8A TaxID=3127639 RepID=UPI0037574462
MTERLKRIRRTAEEARERILDAAERTTRNGPAGMRLQDIAREAGVSHPTILHHFGSREGLLDALNARAIRQLTRDLSGAMASAQSGRESVARTFATYRDGVAQRLIWLIQADALPKGRRLEMFDEVVESLHRARLGFASPGPVPDIADTRRTIHLITVAALGDALLGGRLRNAGASEAVERDAFEDFLSGLIACHLTQGA